MSESKLVNLNFTVSFLEKFDEFWRRHGYSDRTEAIHDACRKLMKENKKEG